MDKKNIPNKYPNREEECFSGDYMSSASSSDCTGLIPSGSCDSEEKFQNYNDIYDFTVSESSVKKAAQKKQSDGAAPK